MHGIVPDAISSETLSGPGLDTRLVPFVHDVAAFAAYIRMARAVLGWSQHDLARKLGMTQRSVHRIEQGHSAPRRVTVLAIDNLLRAAGLSVEFRTDGGLMLTVPGHAVSASDDGAAGACHYDEVAGH